MTSEVGAKFPELKQCQGAKWRTGNEVNSKSYDDDMRKVMKMEILIVGVAGWLAEDPTVVVKPSPNRWCVTTKPAKLVLKLNSYHHHRTKYPQSPKYTESSRPKASDMSSIWKCPGSILIGV